MTQIRVLIVDDEPLARDGIRLLLEADEDFLVVGEAADGLLAIQAIEQLRPELVFLDIQMPGMNGFDVLKALPMEQLPVVVFVTAYDSYAIRAFEVHALDYVLKPIDASRFQVTLARIKSDMKNRTTSLLAAKMTALLEALRHQDITVDAKPDYLNRFVIKEPERIYFVNVDDIDWIEAADYYVQLHTGKKVHLVRETLNRLESQLDPHKFLRIHRSTIVNTTRIKELKRHFQNEYVVVLHDGTSLKLSRGYRDNMSSLLGDKS